MRKPIIQIQKLSISYGAVQAVRGLSLDIACGEIFGLLGPNGAGKSSTFACIQGLRAPTTGSVLVDGMDVARDSARIKLLLGVQLQHADLFPELTITQLVRLFAAMYNQFPSGSQIAARLQQAGLAQKRRRAPISYLAASSSAWPCCSQPSTTRAWCCLTSRPPGSIRRRAGACGR